MTNHELAEKLRGISTVHDAEPDCDACPFLETEELPEDMKGHYPEDFLCQCDVDRVSLMAADALENQEAHIAALRREIEQLRARLPRWVSVEERLPEKEGRYLCVKRIGKSGGVYMTLMNGDSDGFSLEHIYSDDVTHWMPLPEPPKEG